MTLALGVNSNFGIGEEVTWGTRVAPTIFSAIQSEGIKLSQGTQMVNVLGKGYQEFYINGKRSVAGNFEQPATYEKETGVILKHVLGSLVTTSLGSGSYSHVLTPSGTLPVGLSLYLDRDNAAVGTAYAYVGCQVSEVKISQDSDQVAKLSVTIDGKDEVEVSGVTATYTTPKFLDFTDVSATLKAGGVSVSGVNLRSLDFNIKNKLNDNRYSLGANTKAAIGLGGIRTVEGSMTIEFQSKDHYGYFKDGVELSGNFAWTGPLISGSNYNSLTIDVPRMKLTGGTPTANGEGEILLVMPFTAVADATTKREITITMVNANSTM